VNGDHFHRLKCGFSPQQPDHKSQFLCFLNTIQTRVSQPLLSHSAPPTHLYHYISPLAPCSPPRRSPCGNPVASYYGTPPVVCGGITVGAGAIWRDGLLLAVLLSGVTLARGVGLRRHHFLLGRRSHPADLHDPINLCQGVCCPWGMYSLKPTCDEEA
jgi:hypothetical protein